MPLKRSHNTVGQSSLSINYKTANIVWLLWKTSYNNPILTEILVATVTDQKITSTSTCYMFIKERSVNVSFRYLPQKSAKIGAPCRKTTISLNLSLNFQYRVIYWPRITNFMPIRKISLRAIRWLLLRSFMMISLEAMSGLPKKP